LSGPPLLVGRLLALQLQGRTHSPGISNLMLAAEGDQLGTSRPRGDRCYLTERLLILVLVPQVGVKGKFLIFLICLVGI
jgi:hypothetical protein